MCFFNYFAPVNGLPQDAHLLSLWPSRIVWMCFFCHLKTQFFNFIFLNLIGGGPPEECLLDQTKERHLIELNANIRSYDNPNDVENDTYNETHLFKSPIKNPVNGPSSTATSASILQEEILVSATENDLPQDSHL